MKFDTIPINGLFKTGESICKKLTPLTYTVIGSEVMGEVQISHMVDYSIEYPAPTPPILEQIPADIKVGETLEKPAKRKGIRRVAKS